MTEAEELTKNWWRTANVATGLGVLPATVKRHLAIGLPPKPARRMGECTNPWKPRTIEKWNACRPRGGTQPMRRRIRVRGQQREPELELARTLLQAAREARQQAAQIKPRKGEARDSQKSIWH